MTLFRAFLGGAALVAMTLCAPQAQKLEEASPGTKYTGVATLGNKQIPLPEGEWELVFAEVDRLRSVGGIPIPSANAFLEQNIGGLGKAYIVARTNLEIASRGWKRPGLCDRNDVLHNGSDRNYNRGDAVCWIVDHRPFGRKRARLAFFNKVKKHVRSTAGTATLVLNWHWRNDSADYLRVAHYANPAAHGLPPDSFQRWNESDWHVEAIDESPRKKKFVEAAKAFGAKYRDAITAGFSNKLGKGVSGLRIVQASSFKWPSFQARYSPGPSVSTTKAKRPTLPLTPAAPGTPDDLANFGGLWEGWMCRNRIRDVKVAISKVTREGAEVEYHHADDKFRPVDLTLSMDFDGDLLQATIHDKANLTLGVRSDGHMNLKFEVIGRWRCAGIMRRTQVPPKP